MLAFARSILFVKSFAVLIRFAAIGSLLSYCAVSMVRAAEIQPLPGKCGDASSRFGTQCSLRELIEGQSDFDKGFISSAGWRIFDFRFTPSGSTPMVDPDRIRIEVNDDDASNPVLRLVPDPGTIQATEVTTENQSSGHLDFIDFRFFGDGFDLTGITIAASFHTTSMTGNAINCTGFDNTGYEGGFVRLAANLANPATGVGIPESGAAIFDPQTAFPGTPQTPSSMSVVVPGSPGARVVMAPQGTICDDAFNANGFRGEAEIESASITIHFNGGPTTPPPGVTNPGMPMPWLLLLLD